MACAQEVQGLSSGDVLVLVVNAAAQTAPHQVQALLDRMIRTGSENQATGARVGVLHVADSQRSSQKHFYADVDFVLRQYCRGAGARGSEVCVGCGLGGLPVAMNPRTSGAGAGGGAGEESREYVWTLIAEVAEMPARQALVVEAMRYSGEGLVLDTSEMTQPTASSELDKTARRARGDGDGSGSSGGGGWLDYLEEVRAVLRNADVALIDGGDVEAEELMIEALEAGALPVLETGAVAARVFGGGEHPIIVVAPLGSSPDTCGGGQCWVEYLHAALGPPEGLRNKRALCQQWYAQHRERISARVASLIIGDHKGESSSSSSSSSVAAAAAAGGLGTRGSRSGVASGTGGGKGASRADSIDRVSGGVSQRVQAEDLGQAAREARVLGQTHASSSSSAPSGPDASAGERGLSHSNRGVSSAGATGPADRAADRVQGGVTAWATETLGIKKAVPPPQPQPAPPSPPATLPQESPPAAARGGLGPQSAAVTDRGIEVAGADSGWRFHWQAGASVCNG